MHNTWEACSRKWYDYDEAMHIWDTMEYINKRLKLQLKMDWMMEKDAIDYVKDVCKFMTSPSSCSDCITHRPATMTCLCK